MRKRAGSRIDEFAAQVAADMTADLEAGSRSYYTGRASDVLNAVNTEHRSESGYGRIGRQDNLRSALDTFGPIAVPIYLARKYPTISKGVLAAVGSRVVDYLSKTIIPDWFPERRKSRYEEPTPTIRDSDTKKVGRGGVNNRSLRKRSQRAWGSFIQYRRMPKRGRKRMGPMRRKRGRRYLRRRSRYRSIKPRKNVQRSNAQQMNGLFKHNVSDSFALNTRKDASTTFLNVTLCQPIDNFVNSFVQMRGQGSDPSLRIHDKEVIKTMVNTTGNFTEWDDMKANDTAKLFITNWKTTYIFRNSANDCNYIKFYILTCRRDVKKVNIAKPGLGITPDQYWVNIYKGDRVNNTVEGMWSSLENTPERQVVHADITPFKIPHLAANWKIKYIGKACPQPGIALIKTFKKKAATFHMRSFKYDDVLYYKGDQLLFITATGDVTHNSANIEQVGTGPVAFDVVVRQSFEWTYDKDERIPDAYTFIQKQSQPYVATAKAVVDADMTEQNIEL